MRGRDKFAKFKSVISFCSKMLNIFPKKMQRTMLVKFRNVTGLKGIVLRYMLLKNLCASCGDNVSVHPGVYIFNPQNLKIGDNVSIHPMSYIEAYGGITIRSDVSIAHNVTIMSVTHNFENKEIPINNQGITGMPVEICDNVWIGAKAVILGNVKVSRGCVIGASALVNKDTQENAVYAGVPARFIKNR